MTSTTRTRRILVAGAIAMAVGIGGGSIGAVPPDDSDDDELEELAESAFQKWVVSHGTSPIGGTLACAVDSVGTQLVYCYGQTEFGIVAASAPIPTAGAWEFTLLAGSLDGGGVPVPTGPNPLETTVPTTLPDTTVPPTAPPPTAPPPTAPPGTGVPPTSAAAQSPGAAFGEGMHLVNTEIAPGRYQTTATDFCYWERLSAPDDELDSIIANDVATEGPIVVDIDPTDVAFNSERCGEWQPYAPPPAPATSFGAGAYVVGSDIEPGTYRAEGGPDCFWYRLSGFGGEIGDIIEIEPMDSPGTVDVLASDVGFKTRECGTWTLETRLARPSR